MTAPEDLSATILSLPDGSLKVSVTKKGLHINKLLFVEGGKTHDLIPSPETFTGVKAFQACVVGRYCNRLPAKALTLPSGLIATPVVFPPGAPGTSLHSGPSGYDQRQWDLINVSASTLFTPSEKKAIQTSLPSPQSQLFTLISKDGDGGFPGELKLEVLVAVVKRPGEEKAPGGTVLVIYRAALQKGGMETPINITQHWGFNVEDTPAGVTAESTNILEQNLTIKSSKLLECEGGIPTGNLLPISDGSSHDHRSGKAIGSKYPAGGYDNFYLLDPKVDTPANPSVFLAVDLKSSTADFVTSLLKPSSPPSPLATLASKKSGVAINFTSNQLGVQFWSANGGEGLDRKKIHGGKSDGSSVYGSDYAAFLEFHAPYDTFVVPKLAASLGKGAFNGLLEAGQVYNNTCAISVSGSSK